MDVLAALSQISSLEQLPALVRALGHTPTWEELPPASLPVPVQAAGVVGRAGSFEWLGISVIGAEPAARKLSARLAAQGRIAGVLALDAGTAVLTIAISVDHTAWMTLPIRSPGPPQIERLARLVLAGSETGVSYALRALELLAGEDAGRRFFAAFRSTLESMAQALPGRLGPEDRRTLALVQLTRILFLYFVQAKGWLDGQPDFLRRALDDGLARRRQLHRDLFRPLFFGTLYR
jgi:hypothetical protein